MVRILLAGARGGLGRVLTERLGASGLSLSPSRPGPVEVRALSRDELDVARKEHVDRAVDDFRPDIVVGAAGMTQVDLCESYQWEAYLVNRDGTEHLARACGRHGAQMVYVGTDLVFDGAKRAPYTEEDPPNPLSVYADTKLAGELVLMKAAPKHLILRTGWLYGHPGRHFLRSLHEGVREGEILFAYDDQVGQPTYVHDFIDALFFLLSHGHTGTFHVASSGEATQYAAVKRAADAAGLRQIEVRPLQHQLDGRQAMRPRYSVLSCAKLEKAGHRMRAWDAGVKDYVHSLGAVRASH